LNKKFFSPKRQPRLGVIIFIASQKQKFLFILAFAFRLPPFAVLHYRAP
jgi:hypothetical protein